MITAPAPSLDDSRRESAYVLPAASTQERLWIMDRLNPASPFYNITHAARLIGPLDAGALARALRTVAMRHESLRARIDFDPAAGRVVQIVSTDAALALAVVDVGGQPAAVSEGVRACARRPFVLSRAPLARVFLFRCAPTEHVLVVTMHHAIGDGWSTGVFVRDLIASYDAALDGREPGLPPLTVQLGDYAAWQREWLASADAQEHLAALTRRLGGGEDRLRLPFDRPRPPLQTFAGRTLVTTLETDVAQAVASVARRLGATPFMTLLAAFAAVLSRYAGAPTVTIGAPVANRGRVELEGIIGPLINVIVLRIDLSGRLTFRQIVERVRDVAKEAYAHSQVPFERLVEALQPQRDLSAHPLFDVMFSLQNTPPPVVDPRNLVVERVDVDRDSARVALTVDVTQDDDRFHCAFEYNTDLFDEATVAELAGCFGDVLERGIADPDRRLWTPAPGRLDDDARAASERRRHRGDVSELFASRAAARPDAVAARCRDETITYGALHRRATTMAAALRRRGAGPERIVALCAERSLEMLMGMLAILDAGAAYLPLDPSHPPARLREIVSDARPDVMLTERRVAGRLPDTATPVAFLDETDGDTIDGRDHPRAGSDDLAYVIYTSGSTGRPKGVGVPRSALANLLASMRGAPGLDAADVVVAVTTIAFDIATLELLLPLVCGATVVIAPVETVNDGAALARLVADSQATMMQATPATWRLLAESGVAARRDLKVLIGGEALPRALADELLARYGQVWNMYGPTETTIWSSAWPVQAGAGAISLGSPIDATRLHVLDRDLWPVPGSAVGELYIAGEGVARGYLRAPRQTAERFLPDPFAGAAGARMYATGDLVRRRSDGPLIFLGRADRQLKVRGHRIEPAEIEEALLAVDGVREAVAMCEADAPGDGRITAFVGASSAGVSAAALREHVGARLPAYLIPSRIQVVERLPRNTSGKVDLQVLRSMKAADTGYATTHRPPRTPTEETIGGIWREVLRLTRVGVDDNFFDVGGHSLLLARAHRRIVEATGRDVPFVKMFQYPTVRALAAYLDGAIGSATASADADRAERRRRATRRRHQDRQQRSA